MRQPFEEGSCRDPVLLMGFAIFWGMPIGGSGKVSRAAFDFWNIGADSTDFWNSPS